MSAYLGLGSNSGDRVKNLNAAIKMIAAKAKIIRQSPVIENAALLMNALPEPACLNPYLNLVLEIETHPDTPPLKLLADLKQIEVALGRTDQRRWAPRPIDIDILCWDQKNVNDPNLIIPHPLLQHRDFVINPLSFLDSDLKITDLSALKWKRKNLSTQSLLMAIVNLTPDSFSDGGQIKTIAKLEQLLEQIQHSASFIDFGAESTRPTATPLSSEEEWNRLKPFLSYYYQLRKNNSLLPLVSIDSYHYETLERAVDFGVSIINDVSGFIDKRMSNVINSYHLDYVLMHNLGIPANRSITLSSETSATTQVYTWMKKKLAELARHGISRSRIIIDPGIGFGKTPQQNLDLLANSKTFHKLDCRLMVGPSRKSFLSLFGGAPATSDCLINQNILKYLAGQMIDILRVHDPLTIHKYVLVKQQLRSLNADMVNSNIDLFTSNQHP